MPKPSSALCAGYMPLDVIDDGTPVRRRAGGTAGNVAAILSFLGWDAALAGRIGDESAGDEFVADLARAGVDCRLIDRTPGALTNRLIHHISAGRHSYLYTCPRCAQKLPRSRPLTLEQVAAVVEARPDPDVYFFDRANPATVALAECYAKTGSMVVYEPSTPASAELLRRAIAVATIVKGSVEHGPRLMGSEDDVRQDQIRVITHGAEGARFRIGTGRWHEVGVFEAPVVDASGAGDWTTAGMLYFLAGERTPSEKELREAILFGHSFASLNCAVPGARGLMEGRSRASVLGLATRVRHGESRRPALPSTIQAVRSTGCEWCLLPQHQASSGLETAPSP